VAILVFQLAMADAAAAGSAMARFDVAHGVYFALAATSMGVLMGVVALISVPNVASPAPAAAAGPSANIPAAGQTPEWQANVLASARTATADAFAVVRNSYHGSAPHTLGEDRRQGAAVASMVGFLIAGTLALGLAVPGAGFAALPAILLAIAAIFGGVWAVASRYGSPSFRQLLLAVGPAVAPVIPALLVAAIVGIFSTAFFVAALFAAAAYTAHGLNQTLIEDFAIPAGRAAGAAALVIGGAVLVTSLLVL